LHNLFFSIDFDLIVILSMHEVSSRTDEIGEKIETLRRQFPCVPSEKWVKIGENWYVFILRNHG
jgi:hypothetical protein